MCVNIINMEIMDLDIDKSICCMYRGSERYISIHPYILIISG